MIAAEEAEEQARLAYARARLAYVYACDARAEATRGFREIMRGAKTQVVAQYGADSYAVRAIGWTRTSDRKRPGRRRKAAG
jgi:hypothetical protein